MEERRRKDEENAFFIPMTRLPVVACRIFRRAAEPPFRRIEKERKTKRRRKERRKSGERERERESPPRVLFRIRAEPASAFLLFLPPLLLPSSSPFFFFSSPLLDESARRLITQHYPQASATPAFLQPLFIPLLCPTHPHSQTTDRNPLHPGHRNIKPTLFPIFFLGPLCNLSSNPSSSSSSLLAPPSPPFYSLFFISLFYLWTEYRSNFENIKSTSKWIRLVSMTQTYYLITRKKS